MAVVAAKLLTGPLLLIPLWNETYLRSDCDSERFDLNDFPTVIDGLVLYKGLPRLKPAATVIF